MKNELESPFFFLSEKQFPIPGNAYKNVANRVVSDIRREHNYPGGKTWYGDILVARLVRTPAKDEADLATKAAGKGDKGKSVAVGDGTPALTNQGPECSSTLSSQMFVLADAEIADYPLIRNILLCPP